METGVTLIYDGTFNGFLTAVFAAYEGKRYVTDIIKKDQNQKDIFSKTIEIETDLNKAKRVWYMLRDKHYDFLKNIYFAFLSETQGIEICLYREIVRKLGRLRVANQENSQAGVPMLEDIAYKVSLEKRKWESAIHFNFTSDRPSIVRIKPQYNILPLISRFFRLTYQSHPWIIFDQARGYGIYFDGISTRLITEIPEQFNWADAA
jgi:probable DNA metabolism protein